MRAQVLEAKLHRPSLARHVVARTRFDGALDASTARLVIVHAKAGAGKTTALARYVPRNRTRVAWCALDRADNDPDRFWAHVVAAIGHGLGVEALDLLDEGYGPDAVGASLVTDLQRLSVPIVVVLDNLHVVADPYVYAALDVVVRYAPPLIRIVLAGRERPRLDAIESLHVRGDVLDVDDESLRMSNEEADATLERIV
ncbi:MAG: hypothetical protein QOI55_1161, partial [Actinomycetota bacterium]|nr:hypothetical protein [Actinomycetota bacterium]